ncbi:MAG: class I tRNA ligase family protein, partial [Tidjanibacter sp.]|nr:class I tRNA ligase family protein [Tidjanibacter sp.]
RLIAKDLEAAGLLEKVEDYDNKVGYSERNADTAVEPRLCMQWFLRMQHFADIALPPVMNDELKFYPTKYKTTYNHWLENIQDWCISRQLWWGHRIPAYYLPKGGFVVAENAEQALLLARQKSGDESLQMADLRQDEDVLDTWFSSWLWPISVFDGINHPENEEIKYYYPTNDLVTGPDIIFFWIARMIMAGYEWRQERPFRNVYFTGIVRDKLGRKMSKQLGNSPDPLDLMAQYGADGVRVALLLCTSAGNDLMFDESLCEQGRNFCNKIWNAYRLVTGWEVDNTLAQSDHCAKAVEWFENIYQKAYKEIEEHFEAYRISDAMMTLYRLFWDDFSGWYLEMIKPAYGSPADGATVEATKRFFERLLQLLHPFMPFVTEELWQHVSERTEGESVMLSLFEEHKPYDEKMLAEVDLAREVVGNVRNIRAQRNVPNKEKVALEVIADENYHPAYNCLVEKMAGLSEIKEVSEKNPTAAAFIVKTTQYFVPLSANINVEEELEKMAKELAYFEGFLRTVMGKLSNERFVANAPAAVVENERNKQRDAEAKIAAIKERMAALK